MASSIGALLTPWRLTWYPRLLLAALAVALVFLFCTGEGARIATGRLGGDFPEFYGAGRIVASGQLSHLYDEKTQRDAQRDLIPALKPGEDSGFVPFAYPPQMALLYALLAKAPYRAAFALQTAFSAACLLLAASLLCRVSPPASRHVLALFAAMVFFYPVFRALLGGQNTPLTILLVTVAATSGMRGRDWLAGVALGLLLYKPQFGLTLLGVSALGGRWRVLLGGLGTAGITCAANTLLFGPGWPQQWLGYARWVIGTSMAMESEKAISCLGVFRNLALKTHLPIAWIGYALALAAAVVVALLWLRWARAGAGNGGCAKETAMALPFVGLAAAGTILIAPHAYYYDAGLLWLAFPALAHGDLPRRDLLLATFWAAGFIQPLAGLLGFSPLFLLAVAVFCCLVFLARAALAAAAKEPAALLENAQKAD
ncbi:glycosyltransferase family 87 protein [Desulfovibrio sp. TomC]|uniref:glycosyltransferase family 87 protein n=1 Tax=Desulfovibrio sp. TomC TaxID=1562888 RepID=UPI00057408BE|nr:glycosyltransferase family 87 protein [Desulfovibrio sp. TomC]KHK02042.1 hypothetical protein NY78_2526 [Desulfovibrio sp. TomC]